MKKLLINLKHASHKIFDWRCSKCGIVVEQVTKPAPLKCSQGGSHEWVKIEFL